MKLSMSRHTLTLNHPFTISRSTQTEQACLVVRLRDGDVVGYGEATSNPYYGVTIETMTDLLESARSRIETSAWADPTEFWAAMKPLLGDCPFAQCALDAAAHDLWGKRLGKPVYQLWGLNAADAPMSDYTIGIDTIDMMVRKMTEPRFAGWPIYKIKLGTDHDIDIIRALRQHTGAVFRVDANCAWSADQTLRNAEAMKPLGVEYIEQPMSPERDNQMRRIYEQCVLPVIADESCIVESDVAKCAGLFHGVNIKITKCGGLTPGHRMAAEARRLGLKIMIGCMTESTVGISATAQLAPMIDYADLDGALLIRDDIAEGVKIEKGRVVYPVGAGGTGVTMTD